MQHIDKTLDELLEEGFAHQQSGQFELAKARYEEAIACYPQDVQPLQMLGIFYALHKNLTAAIDLLSRALSLDPCNAFVLFNRATAYLEQGMPDLALADLELAMVLEPRNELGLLTQGNAYCALEQYEEALTCFDQALEQNPTFAKALNNRGLVQKSLGLHREAFKSYAEAITIDPQYADAFNNLGILLMELENLDQAVQCFDAAISLSPSEAQPYNNLGNALNALEKFGEALQSFDKAISLKPDYADAYSNRASALEGLLRLDEAIQSCEIAIGMNSQLAMMHNKMAVMLKEKGEWTRALDALNQAIALRPDYLDAVINKGNVLSLLGRFEEAKACFDDVLLEKPDDELARWNKSLLCLLLGDYKTGWPLYETGWAIKMRGIKREFDQPIWLGDVSIEGKTVLLHAEQGLGDVIQFCRYAGLVKGLGARVLMEAPRVLMPLLQTLEGVDEWVVQGELLPAFDYHCPLMSLPLALKTELHSVPSPTAYLQADPHRAKYWSDRLGHGKRLKVGVVWNGGARPYAPNVWWVNQRRNISLDVFAAGLNDLDVDFYSLQKGEPAESEIRGQELRYWPQGNFFNDADELNDFADTAALIANLDLVIAVDTSTAHLAAALGKPTWILTRYDTCWRWLLERDDSPWYASVKLYRQGEDRDWATTLARVAADIRLI
jgi:tetratricopeptide (TPR) repeat protein